MGMESLKAHAADVAKFAERREEQQYNSEKAVAYANRALSVLKASGTLDQNGCLRADTEFAASGVKEEDVQAAARLLNGKDYRATFYISARNGFPIPVFGHNPTIALTHRCSPQKPASVGALKKP